MTRDLVTPAIQESLLNEEVHGKANLSSLLPALCHCIVCNRFIESLIEHFPWINCFLSAQIVRQSPCCKCRGDFGNPNYVTTSFPIHIQPFLAVIWIHLVALRCRHLDNEVALLKFIKYSRWIIMHRCNIDCSPLYIDCVVVSREVRQHFSKGIRVQLPYAFSMCSCERQQYGHHFHVSL